MIDNVFAAAFMAVPMSSRGNVSTDYVSSDIHKEIEFIHGLLGSDVVKIQSGYNREFDGSKGIVMTLTVAVNFIRGDNCVTILLSQSDSFISPMRYIVRKKAGQAAFATTRFKFETAVLQTRQPFDDLFTFLNS